jgi:hypothetical protein
MMKRRLLSVDASGRASAHTHMEPASIAVARAALVDGRHQVDERLSTNRPILARMPVRS